ncbi:hypothetical protein DICVIV_04419 [Dictyocaulus viviparus]|uniref:Folate-sensitive fragile site protein Fra10Ac1 n=1 Tax=Dictyocaulus viviparus TaxID=29172 RepID=A0A0D8Y019_DICVI|nr:hypothetical protein DICVIV_04419 [Dictyocaulus viviparus]
MDDHKRNPEISVDDLQSEFDYRSETERNKRKRSDFYEKDFNSLTKKAGRNEARAWFQDEHGRVHRQISRMMAMDAYSRHKELINLYYLSYPGATKAMRRDTSKDKTDYDVLKDNHKFLWSEADEASSCSKWETQYCIIDLTYFKKNKIAMRWRTEAEVRSGKGQFICGSKKCSADTDLSSWEVNFGYTENGERKNALVKVRLCRQCSEMLNYGSQKRKVEKKIKNKKKKLSGKPDNAASNQVEASNNVVSKQEEAPSTSNEISTSDVWSGPVQDVVRTIDDDIDEFLDDLFE